MQVCLDLTSLLDDASPTSKLLVVVSAARLDTCLAVVDVAGWGAYEAVIGVAG